MPAIPTSAQDLFDRLVPAALLHSPQKARALDTSLCFKIEGGGAWTIDCAQAPPTCVQGSSDAARCTVEIANADFMTMLADPNAGMQLYFQKKLRLSGDPTQAIKIAALFDLLRAVP